MSRGQGRKEEGGRRKEEGGRRKEEGGRRKEEGGRRRMCAKLYCRFIKKFTEELNAGLSKAKMVQASLHEEIVEVPNSLVVVRMLALADMSISAFLK